MPDEPAAPATGPDDEPTTPDEPPAPDPAAEPEQPKPTETVDYWKQRARQNETRAKNNAGAAKELADLKASMMTETEKAVAEAEARGRASATADAGQRLAAAEIKAALTGVVPNPGAIAEDLNLAKYVTDDGEVDAEAIAGLRAKFAELAAKDAPPAPGSRPKEDLPSVPLPNSDRIQLDDEKDPRKLASRIRRM